MRRWVRWAKDGAMWTSFPMTVLAMGLAGALIALGIALAIPIQWRTEAALRLLDRPPGSTAGASQDQLQRNVQQLTHESLGRDKLIALITKLDLYPAERRRWPIEELAQEMRGKHLRVQLPKGSTQGATFRIAFEYPDQRKASRVVSEISSQYRDNNIRHGMQDPTWPKHSILEVGIGPEIPVFPPSEAITLLGLLAGTMAGFLLVWARRARDYRVLLPADAKSFVHDQIRAGTQGSANDYILDLIRVEQQRQSVRS